MVNLVGASWTRFLDPRCKELPTEWDIRDAFQDGVAARKRLAMNDTFVRHEYGVDWNLGFLEEDSPLFVNGGYDALGNWTQMVMDEGDEITILSLSSDLHHLFQVFFNTMWKYGPNFPTKGLRGLYVKPCDFKTGELTIISEESLNKGLHQAVYDPAWQHFYASELRRLTAEDQQYYTFKTASKDIWIYEFHCIESTRSAMLAPAVQVAKAYWEGRRGARSMVWFKGNWWASEMYAPQEAEVKHPEDPNSELTGIYNDLEVSDQIGVGGLAETHCVFEFHKKNIKRFASRRPEILERMILRRSQTAPIVYPGYEDDLKAFYTAAVNDYHMTVVS